MTEAVFDASALILMAKIGLLNQISKEIDVYTTEEVYEEATRAEAYDAEVIKQRAEEDKVNIEEVSEERKQEVLEKFNLDRGEASAIALHKQSETDIIATDDKQAINACKILKVKFTTSLKLLERTHEKGLINQEDALAKLNELERYGWYRENQVKTTEQNIRGE